MAAKSGDHTAFGELAGIASGGNLHARELFRTIDGMPFASFHKSTPPKTNFWDRLFPGAIGEGGWSIDDRERMAKGELPKGRPTHPED